MNSLVLVGYYMVKEAVKPRLHHAEFEEYLEDVDMDCFRHTHILSINNIKSTSSLLKSNVPSGISFSVN